MGRELRRKQAKKDGKSLERDEVVEEQHLRRYVVTLLVIIIVLSALYILSSLFITKELDWFKKNDVEEQEKEEKKNDILASEVFKQTEEEYYVYFYDFNETENAITADVNAKLAYYALYTVNTSSVMNANYVSDVGNKKAKSLKDLKVVPTTLIKITNGVITEYYEQSEITRALS